MKALVRIASLLLVVGSLSACGGAEPKVFPEANLVLVSIDTLRADHLSLYGYERPTSPYLETLAKESIVFENVIAQSTWTTPSHAAMFTSRYPTELGLRSWPDPGRIPDAFPTLPESLRNEGFATHAFTESAWMAGKFGFERGFDRYDSTGGLMRRIFPRMEIALPSFVNDRFFLFLHTYDVHWYEPIQEALRPFERPYRGSLRPSNQLRRDVQNPRNRAWRESLTPTDLDYLVDLYDGSIREVDGYLERLVEVLKKAGVWENTLLVITADHGEEFLEHGLTGHGFSAYDEQIRVPLIVRLPKGAHGGRRVREQARSIDLYPTLLEWLGVSDPPVGLRGRSLAPVLDGKLDEIPAFVDRGHVPKVCIRTPEWKLIHDTKFNGFEAYELSSDPAESKNLARDEGAVPVELRTALSSWLDGLERPADPEPTPALTEREKARMTELGYTIEGEGDDAEKDGGNPKEQDESRKDRR